MPDERPTLLPPLSVIYGRLGEVERERKELRSLLRLALDRHDQQEADRPETSGASAGRQGGTR